MKHFIILLFVSQSAMALDQDKMFHAGGSAVISYASSKYYLESEHPVLYPVALTMGMAVLKEAVDPVFDHNDISASAIGTTFGTMMANQNSIMPGWENRDKLLFQSYAWMNVLDVIQTRKCLGTNNCTEANPLFGKHPSSIALTIGKVAGTGAVYWIAETSDHRTATLIGANIIQFAVIRHNYFEMEF